MAHKRGRTPATRIVFTIVMFFYAVLTWFLVFVPMRECMAHLLHRR